MELDLDKNLVPAISIFVKDRTVEYEGLHLVCFNCGKYGHHRDVCPHSPKAIIPQDKENDVKGKANEKNGNADIPEKGNNQNSDSTSKRGRTEEETGDVGDGATVTQKDKIGIWNLVRKFPRNQGVNAAKSAMMSNKLDKTGGNSVSATRRVNHVNPKEAVMAEKGKASFSQSQHSRPRKDFTKTLCPIHAKNDRGHLHP